MIHSIQSDLFTAEINDKGAELYSLFSKKTKTEYLWQGDPAVWDQRAPVLFPVVARLKDGKYSYNGKDYNMSIHGFVLDAPFTTLGAKGNSIILTYEDTPETRAIYPFSFTFRVVFTLHGSALEIVYQVINKTDGPMYFSCGSHEGYRCPRDEGETFDDYYLEFEKEAVYASLLSSPDILLTKSTYTVLENEKILPLSYDLFSNDSLVFANVPSNRVTLCSRKSTARVEIAYEDCPHLALWTRPDAHYICIEPWYGLPDFEDTDGQLVNKAGIISLKKSDVFSWKHTVTVFE